MLPRLLQRNQRAIAAAAAQEERARLLARRVLLLARHWRVDELPEALSSAEAAVAASADRQAHAELALARGVALYYGAQPGLSVEPVRQARDAAVALDDAALEAECEAWLGCIGATLHEASPQVLQHLGVAVTLGLRHRPLAAARALYIAATLYQEADLIETAAAHYRRASALARAEHDEQLLAAIHRYMTLGQVQQLRRAHAAGRLDDEHNKQALAGLGSAQQLAATLSADDDGLQFRLRQGEMLRLSGRYADALEVFSAHLGDAARRGLTFEATIARADQALCLAHVGRFAEAGSVAELAEAELAVGFDPYTHGVVLGSLAEVAGLLGEGERAATLAVAATRCWDEDRAYCTKLHAALLAWEPAAT